MYIGRNKKKKERTNEHVRKKEGSKRKNKKLAKKKKEEGEGEKVSFGDAMLPARQFISVGLISVGSRVLRLTFCSSSDSFVPLQIK